MGWIIFWPWQWQMQCHMISSSGLNFVLFGENFAFQQNCGEVFAIGLSKPGLAYRPCTSFLIVKYTDLDTWMHCPLGSGWACRTWTTSLIAVHLHSCVPKHCANVTQRRWYLPSSGGWTLSLTWQAISKWPFLQKAAAVCPCFWGPQERVGTAAEEKNLQICNGEEEQEVRSVEDASGLRTLSSSSLCLLVWRRMKGAETT